MPTPRVLMSKIRQALQLLADSGLSMRQVAAALGVSKSTVSEIAMYARDAGVDWPQASSLSDDELQARLYPPPRPRSSTRQEPDYAALHLELKRPGVTLQLLWEEYRAQCRGWRRRRKYCRWRRRWGICGWRRRNLYPWWLRRARIQPQCRGWLPILLLP